MNKQRYGIEEASTNLSLGVLTVTIDLSFCSPPACLKWRADHSSLWASDHLESFLTFSLICDLRDHRGTPAKPSQLLPLFSWPWVANGQLGFSTLELRCPCQELHRPLGWVDRACGDPLVGISQLSPKRPGGQDLDQFVMTLNLWCHQAAFPLCSSPGLCTRDADIFIFSTED